MLFPRTGVELSLVMRYPRKEEVVDIIESRLVEEPDDEES